MSSPFPVRARTFINGEPWCNRVVDGRAVRTRLELGEANDNRVEVRSGLREGDTVVVDARVGRGEVQISDGQPIKVKPSSPEKAGPGRPNH